MTQRDTAINKAAGADAAAAAAAAVAYFSRSSSCLLRVTEVSRPLRGQIVFFWKGARGRDRVRVWDTLSGSVGHRATKAYFQKTWLIFRKK